MKRIVRVTSEVIVESFTSRRESTDEVSDELRRKESGVVMRVEPKYVKKVDRQPESFFDLWASAMSLRGWLLWLRGGPGWKKYFVILSSLGPRFCPRRSQCPLTAGFPGSWYRDVRDKVLRASDLRRRRWHLRPEGMYSGRTETGDAAIIV